MKIGVIVFGATGMVGEGVLFKALSHEDVESVLVIGRRPCMVTHLKLKEIIHHDFFNYSIEQGRIMWARVKGRTENHLAKLPFKSVYSFRPGFIKSINGQRNVRPFYKVLMWPYPLWKVLFPGAISTLSDVGLAMINATLYGYSKQVLENLDIAQLARTKREAITL